MESSKGVGRTFRRGEVGYEAARKATMWNARLPDRFPDVIVQANDVYDVLAAIRTAKREGHRVGVRSGGHSWAGNHVRDGGMLLDVSRLDDVAIDAKAMRAIAGPGRAGHEMSAMLAREKLFFPAGHCRGVGIGGFLLQGGYGWHSRALGPACMSVEGIDVVTADGDVVFASDRENADLFWAARGAGPGFFGVVTRFHLRLHPRPKVIGFALQSFPIDALDEVFRWAHAIGPEVPASVELQLVISHDTPGLRRKGITVFAPVFADSLLETKRALAFMHDSPLRKKTARNVPFLPSGQALMYRGVTEHYPNDHRYAVDNMWTHAPIDALLPGLRAIADTLPPSPSHALWLNWAPPKNRPDMAYSIEDDVYLALYGVWKHAEDDARYASWAVDQMKPMQSLSVGCQLADENLAERPQRFMTDANMAKLDALRAAHDAHGRFHPWMGRP